mgnify:FL=1
MIVNFNYSGTFINYSLAYDCCAKVIAENNLYYPLDTFSLVQSYGIKVVSYSKLSSHPDTSFQEIVNSFSSYGFLSRDKKTNRAIIYYNDTNAKEIINFTLLHELGHYLMNHEKECKENENLANCFARNLIAPASICFKLGLVDPYKLSDYFHISLSAANVRLDFLQRDLNNINKLGKHTMLYYKSLAYV